MSDPELILRGIEALDRENLALGRITCRVLEAAMTRVGKPIIRDGGELLSIWYIDVAEELNSMSTAARKLLKTEVRRS